MVQLIIHAIVLLKAERTPSTRSRHNLQVSIRYCVLHFTKFCLTNFTLNTEEHVNRKCKVWAVSRCGFEK